MSFLNQLKSQASALQTAQGASRDQQLASMRATENAAKTAWLYVAELAKQLNVLAPAGPKLSLDGKKPWPAMKLVDFRCDARKKKHLDHEVLDYITMGWRIVPVMGQPVDASVSANFPPELERIEKRVAIGNVKHERVNVRHPEKNTLKEIRFDYQTEARGGVTITADSDGGQLAFRVVCAQGFDMVNLTVPAAQIQTPLLDELAKLIVGQPSTFVT